MAELSYRQALHDTLRTELLRDESVILLGEEIGVFEGSYKITAGLLGEFGPERVRDTPIAEEGFVGVAVGAAMLGLRPVVEIMTINFSLLAIDQIVNHAAKIHSMFGGQVSVPMVIRTPGGGGQQLAATHSQNIEVWYAHMPGLKVVAPSTPADAKALLTAAIRDDDPVLVLENLSLYNTKGEVPDGEQVGRLGEAAIVREGTDLTVIAYSRATTVAVGVAGTLAAQGVSVEVVDLRSLRPTGPGDRLCVSAQDQPCGRAGGRLAHVWRRRGDSSHRSGGRVRLPGRPGSPGRCCGGSAALCQVIGAGCLAGCRGPDPGHQRGPRRHELLAVGGDGA